jgi:hypothetical protein
MPNKLFEVIQARLAVLASPLVDISAFLNEYDVGLVSASFSPEALAETINHLSPELIDGFKSNSDRLAEKFSQRHNNDKLDKIIEHCLGDR